MCVGVHVCMPVCDKHARMCVFVCVCARMHACMSACVRQACIHACVCVYVVFVCVRACICCVGMWTLLTT